MIFRPLLSILFFSIFFRLFAFAGVTVENGLTHTYSGNWGDVLTGTIKLTNSGKKTERVLVSSNDLLQSCDNNRRFTDPNSHQRSSASWIKLNTSERTLAAGESYEIVYNITVPKDTSYSGTYWSVIMVEVADPIKVEKSSKGVTVGTKINYAVQVITDVGPGKPVPISYEDVKIENGGTGKVVKVSLKNEGIFVVSPRLIVEVFSKEGNKIRKVELPPRKIYPGSCKLYEVDLKDVPNGTYECVMIADYGQDLFGMNASLELE